jgi:hypothetical protein
MKFTYNNDEQNGDKVFCMIYIAWHAEWKMFHISSKYVLIRKTRY